MPRPPALSSLKKITFPTPLTVGTDIVHIPRIHEIICRSRTNAGTAWAFARRILTEEEIEGSKHRFESIFRNHDELRRTWVVAKAFRKEVDSSGVLKGVNKVEEEFKGPEGAGKEIDSLVGEGVWEGVVPMGRVVVREETGDVETTVKEDCYMLSKEGVIMTVLRAVIEWKKGNRREDMLTPWGTLMECVNGGKDLEGVIDAVLNTLRISNGQEPLGKQAEDVEGGKVGIVGEHEKALLGQESDMNPLHHETGIVTYKPMLVNKDDHATKNAGVDTPTQALDHKDQDSQPGEISPTRLHQEIDSKQTPPKTRPNEVENMLMKYLTKGQSFNIETESFQESTKIPSTPPAPKPDTNKSEDIKHKWHIPPPSKIHKSNAPSTTSLKSDIALFLALERSLHASIQQAEIDLQKPAIFLAGRFAAKEAIMKAYHSRRLTYHDIVIAAQPADETGSKPPLGYVLEDGEAREVKFSISHHKEYATATAMVYTAVEKEVEMEDKKKKAGKNRLKGRFWKGKKESEESGNELNTKKVDPDDRVVHAKVRRVDTEVDELGFRKIVVVVEERGSKESLENKKNADLLVRRIEGNAVEVQEGNEGFKTRYPESKFDQVPTFLW